jgi:hypothetical protein
MQSGFRARHNHRPCRRVASQSDREG